jgi:RIO-like serine/threonine protein kinase
MADHANAEDLLERDLKNILTFFSRRFNLKVDVELACNYVIGKARSLAI